MPRKSELASRWHGIKARKTGNKQPTPTILIVCEGEKTEPDYFEQFPVPKDVRKIFGLGMDPLRLVQEAKKLQRLFRKERGYDYGQVWCVFDRDEFSLERFNQALQLATASGFQVAYSNPAFEIWYLLHFGYSDRPMMRHACCSALSNRLGRPYEKTRSLYGQLQSAQAAAIGHATRLLSQYDPPDPANDNPSTTVHLLVQELNRHTRP